MTTTTGPAAPPQSPERYRWRWVALFVVLAAEVMDMLDALITNIASPAIRADLGGGASTMQWLGAAYTLAMAVGLMTGGRLGDIVGRRRMFLIGAVGFTVCSMLCALATSPEMLIGSRGLQGLFGAVMIPQGLGMIKEMFDEEEMGKAFGLFGPVMGLSSVAGPVLAGWLIDADFFGTGWRMIFFINLPLGLLALAGGVKFLPESRSATPPRLDLVGAALASVAAFLIILPLVQGRELDWPAWTFFSMAAAVVLFGVFGWFESRKNKAGGDPLIVPTLFRKRAFSGGLVMGMVFFSGMAGFSLLLSLFMQLGLGYSPLKAGLAGVPWSIGIIAGFGLVQAIMKYGRVVIQAGCVIMAGGVGTFLFTLHLAGTGVTPWQTTPALILTGLGMGLIMGPFFDMVLAGVEPAETGSAGGVLTAVQQLGSALGIAVLGTLFFGMLGGQIAHATDQVAPKALAAAGVPAQQRDALVAGLRACGRDQAESKDLEKVPASCTKLPPQVVGKAAHDASALGFTGAMKIALWVEIGLLGLTFLAAFLLPRYARPKE